MNDQSSDIGGNLSAQDQQVLDALVAGGFKLEALPPDQVERGRKMMQLLGLLDHLPAPSPGDLLEARTMQMIEQAGRSGAASADRATGTCGRMLTWPEVLSLAAALLLGVSVLWPAVSRSRAVARQSACQANLAGAAIGFGQYAADHDGVTPRTKSGNRWWLVNQFDDEGAANSNSAHLYLLIRHDYVKPELLNCPANQDAPRSPARDARDWPTHRAVSYSYQNQYIDSPFRWGEQNIAVLADKNPFFGTGFFHGELPGETPSPNHRRLAGQNVLTNTGEVTWLRKPMINHSDYIYQASDRQVYTGTEPPADTDDTFLVP